MSKNVIHFPVKIATQTEPKQFGNAYGLDLSGSKHEIRKDMFEQYKDYDFRKALERFPEHGMGLQRDKHFVINHNITLRDYVGAAHFALDLKGDVKAHDDLMGIYFTLKEAGFKKYPVKHINPQLVGYVINLVVDRDSRPGIGVPPFYYLCDSYFGPFQASGWSNNADYERASIGR